VDRQTFSKSFPVREKIKYEKQNKLQKRTTSKKTQKEQRIKYYNLEKKNEEKEGS
jgi:hypothetical protein